MGSASTTPLVPSPGLFWGRYPMRAPARQRPPAGPRRPDEAYARHRAVLTSWLPLRVRGGPGQPARDGRFLATVRAHQATWAGFDTPQHDAALRELRARLARDGWPTALRAEALGCVAAAARRCWQHELHDAQLFAADVLLDDEFAELATGEGKTWAAAVAVAVAALAGVPVHVMTANDYLVARDAEQLRGFYAALGLSVGRVLASSSAAERRAAYACHVTYCTAREAAFDHLRDSLNPAEPLLRGLCMAVLDEADSLLIDEATLPLVLSEAVADPAQRAACVQALALARQLRAGDDFQADEAARSIAWTPAGEARLQALSAGYAGAWHNRRHRQDLTGAALEALHLLQRDRDYLVREGRVELLDAVTGRVAAGRVWSRGVQALVELKEGLPPSPATRTCAQIGFQGFFARYLRLCGTSGTLAEARRELAALYGRRVVAVASRSPSRRVDGPPRLFADASARRAAAVRRVQELHASGRPVLVGTDAVADSQALSDALAAAGVPHAVLDARHDADEARIVAAAAQPGAVTVATRMAGRGTDIALAAGVAALGGLHVLCCQDNPSRRLDRQLVGRCARQGDPGSAEVWRCADAPGAGGGLASSLRWLGRRQDERGALRLPAWAVRAFAARVQGAAEGRARRQRRRLLEMAAEWDVTVDFSRGPR